MREYTKEDWIKLVKDEWLTVILIILFFATVYFYTQRLVECNNYYIDYMTENCTEFVREFTVNTPFTINIT